MFRFVFIVTLVGVAFSAPSSKIEGQLGHILNAGGVADVVVIFNKDTNVVLPKVENMKIASRGARISTMMAELEFLREDTQRNVLTLLENRAIRHVSLWINNRLYISGADLQLVDAIAAFSEVVEIRKQIQFKIGEPVTPNYNSVVAQWGIEIIEADQAWSIPGGNNGQGVVVSNIDTGVRHTHETLRNNYRSSYGWYDPYELAADPVDENGHGTHTMGTIAGSNGIGVAPGAQWISCRGCVTEYCLEVALSSCGQWVTCPTLATGTSPNCEMAPAVVSNSWGFDQGSTWYDSIINAWHLAGIIPVFAAGNSGSDCETVVSPGDSPDVISVGATDIVDDIAFFSSRGPSINRTLKPDVSAPGLNVLSAWNTSDTDYMPWAGTSMACPHVAGAVSLLLSQNPNLSYVQVKNYLQDHADRSLGTAEICGGTPPTTFPNNIYGYGRINARRSLAAAIGGHG